MGCPEGPLGGLQGSWMFRVPGKGMVTGTECPTHDRHWAGPSALCAQTHPLPLSWERGLAFPQLAGLTWEGCLLESRGVRGLAGTCTQICR